MTVAQKAQSSSNVIKKTPARSVSITSTRSPSQIEEMGDTDFGSLGADKDGYIVSYDSTTDKFILISPDQVLTASSEDADLPDEFISQLETELDLGTIQLDSLDGGSF